VPDRLLEWEAEREDKTGLTKLESTEKVREQLGEYEEPVETVTLCVDALNDHKHSTAQGSLVKPQPTA